MGYSMIKLPPASLLWRARAYAGESDCSAESLALLSMVEGEAGAHGHVACESSKALSCLSAMLVNLAIAARHYCPLEPRAQPVSSMAILVDCVTNRSTSAGESAAWLSVAYENCRASATVWDGNDLIGEIGPVNCKGTDGIWDIVLRILCAMFPEFSHR